MKSFRDFLKEDVIPTVLVKDGSIDLNNPAVRENINVLLSGAVSSSCVTPYIALNKVRKVLANFHIELPKKAYMEGNKGVEVYEMQQFGHKMGMTNDGEFVKEVPATFYLFFKYQSIGPMFTVVAKVLEKPELDKYLDYAEASLSEDAQEQQSLAKAKAPKEDMHGIDDCSCSSGNSPSTKAAIDTSLRKNDKKLSASSLEEGDIDMRLHKDRIKKLRTDVLEEDDDQLDEVSLGKLVNYRRGAEQELGDIKHYKKNPGQYPAATSDDRKRAERSEKTREAGIKLADKKMKGKAKVGASAPKHPYMEENQIDEKAPPGAKFERMVKHIKKGYSKDGLSAKEKSIAYATAWKAKNREKGE